MSAIRSRNATEPRKQSGAWLSLFAMLMIFIGPLISQSMPMEHHTGLQTPASMAPDMGISTPMNMSADAHSGHHAAPAETAGVDHVLWAKCGYCTLLFSCPALTQTLAVTAPVPPNPADFYKAGPQQGHARSNVFPNARSRAPPSSSVA